MNQGSDDEKSYCLSSRMYAARRPSRSLDRACFVAGNRATRTPIAGPPRVPAAAPGAQRPSWPRGPRWRTVRFIMATGKGETRCITEGRSRSDEKLSAWAERSGSGVNIAAIDRPSMPIMAVSRRERPVFQPISPGCRKTINGRALPPSAKLFESAKPR
jgi:hypothetical protein